MSVFGGRRPSPRPPRADFLRPFQKIPLAPPPAAPPGRFASLEGHFVERVSKKISSGWPWGGMPTSENRANPIIRRRHDLVGVPSLPRSPPPLESGPELVGNWVEKTKRGVHYSSFFLLRAWHVASDVVFGAPLDTSVSVHL